MRFVVGLCSEAVFIICLFIMSVNRNMSRFSEQKTICTRNSLLVYKMAARSLDRSLDKNGFKNLNRQDKLLVDQLRNAVEGVHGKIEALRDGLDERFVLRTT